MKKFLGSVLCAFGFHDYIKVYPGAIEEGWQEAYRKLNITTLECTRCKNLPHWR